MHTHTALPRPPSDTVCEVDIGNRVDLADEGMEATGQQTIKTVMHAFVKERSLHLISQVMLNEHLH